ncbi:MAG TPA: dihydrofolate reductase family protein, partial [Vicinamibacterales bacterium]|nr:dihydrofolate reductase family protein [Vicinamibacterales bacterium]
VWLFGGANVARQFLDAGIVDRIELFVVPLLLGSGIRLFERLDRGVALQLNELKEHAKGVVQVTYSVVR